MQKGKTTRRKPSSLPQSSALFEPWCLKGIRGLSLGSLMCARGSESYVPSASNSTSVSLPFESSWSSATIAATKQHDRPKPLPNGHKRGLIWNMGETAQTQY